MFCGRTCSRQMHAPRARTHLLYLDCAVLLQLKSGFLGFAKTERAHNPCTGQHHGGETRADKSALLEDLRPKTRAPDVGRMV